MTRAPSRRLLVAGAASVLVAGAGLAALAAGSTAATGGDQPTGIQTASAAVVRRTIEASDVLEGTLGYAGSYTVSNWLATASEPSSGGSSSTTQAYLAAKAQYDGAVASRDLLRDPTDADVERAKATLAQARAALRTAQQADDGPTAAQRAAARSAVTQAEENLAVATAQRDAAAAALAACVAASDPATGPVEGVSCDVATLTVALDRAEGEVRVRSAQLTAAKAALAGLEDTPPNAASNVAAARASVEAAEATLDALRNPTRARLRQADDAVAVAAAQLDDAKAALGRPTGVVTQIAAVGAIIKPGEVLYTLDGTHAVVLLAGDMPAWRALGPGVADGPDIGQLERSLRALGLGYDAILPDDHWDEDTAEAVAALHEAVGAAPSGTVELGSIVFMPGPIRVTDALVELGSTVRQEGRVLLATSTEREIRVDLEADRQAIATAGTPVTVELPDGTEATGTIGEIGTVASVQTGSGGAEATDAVPTVEVTIALDDPVAAGGLDGAPVDVKVVREQREDVLAVPVSALLALVEGGYAVEVVDGPGQTHLVRVELGLFEDGFVEVRSDELSEGAMVVVPA